MSMEKERKGSLGPQFQEVIGRLVHLVKERETLLQGTKGVLVMSPDGSINFIKNGSENYTPSSSQANQRPLEQFKTALRNYALTVGADFDTANKYERNRLKNGLMGVLVRKEQSLNLSPSETKIIFRSPMGGF